MSGYTMTSKGQWDLSKYTDYISHRKIIWSLTAKKEDAIITTIARQLRTQWILIMYHSIQLEYCKWLIQITVATKVRSVSLILISYVESLPKFYFIYCFTNIESGCSKKEKSKICKWKLLEEISELLAIVFNVWTCIKDIQMEKDKNSMISLIFGI